MVLTSPLAPILPYFDLSIYTLLVALCTVTCCYIYQIVDFWGVMFEVMDTWRSLKVPNVEFGFDVCVDSIHRKPNIE